MAKSPAKDIWKRNFAKNSAVRERILTAFKPRLRRTRDQRFELQQEWMRYFYMWNVTHDENHTYNGRAKLYVPEVRKNVESQARQLTKAAFPNDDFFDVSPGTAGTKKGAAIWKSIQRWNIERSQLRLKFHVFQRQSCLYGTSPAMVVWDKRTETAFRSAYDSKQKKIVPSRKLIEIYNGPNFIPRDLFRWYTLNPKRMDLSDGCFEDMPTSYFDLLAMEKQGLVHGIDEITEGGSDAYAMEELEDDVRRAEATGLQIGNQGYAGEAIIEKDKDIAPNERSYVLTTIWTKAVLPEACLDDEDPEMPIPLQIQIVNNQWVTLVRRNPFFHQQPPYVVGKYVLPGVDEFYGQGIPKAIQFMQYELNSKSEQAMDSATMALNPLAFIDPALASQTAEFEFAPAAKWFVSPQGVKLGAMPDLTPTAYAAIAQLRGQMADYSDRSPNLPPQLMGKSRTATQAEFVGAGMQVDLEAFQMANEIMVLQPLLEQWESLTDQNATEDQIVMILGRRASDWKRMLVKKRDLLGSYQYFWKVASTTQNKPIMARQMLDGFKLMLSLPPEERSKISFKFDEFFKMMWSEMWNLPDADKLFSLPEEMQSQDTGTEHKMLELGMELEVLPGDNDVQHMADHDSKIAELKKQGKDEDAALLVEHNLAHKRQAIKKEQAKEAMVAMQQQMAMVAAMQAQGQGPKKGIGSGNRTQLSPNASTGNMASGVRA